jgi:hypothetical protein
MQFEYIYMCVCIYVCMYIYIYIYTYREREREREREYIAMRRSYNTRRKQSFTCYAIHVCIHQRTVTFEIQKLLVSEALGNCSPRKASSRSRLSRARLCMYALVLQIMHTFTCNCMHTE